MSFSSKLSDLCTKCKDIFTGHWAEQNDLLRLEIGVKEGPDEDEMLATSSDKEKAEPEYANASPCDNESNRLCIARHEIIAAIEAEAGEKGASVSSSTNKIKEKEVEPLEIPRVHRTISGVKMSADNGCGLCTLLWDNIRIIFDAMEELNGFKKELLDARGFASVQPWSYLDFDSEAEDNAGSTSTKADTDLCLEFFYFLKEELHLYNEEFKVRLSLIKLNPQGKVDKSHIVSSGSTSPSSRTILGLSKWLKECQQNHAVCNLRATDRLRSGDTQILPTRLLDLRPQGNHEARLVESLGFDSHIKYATLSHCWGGKVPGRLLKHNYERLKKNIDVENLPQTFQDAISFTKTLGIRYLWIDALCIIQDSKEDWFKEAMLMASVYSFSSVNLAATASTNSYGGLFHPRNLALAAPIYIEASWTGFQAGRYFCYDDFAWERCIERAPLNKRAWVVQERLLSPRTIHCAHDQLWWECVQFRASNAFPEGLPMSRFEKESPGYADPKSQTLRPDLSTAYLALDNVNGTEFNHNWHAIIKQYTKCSLTNGSDKLLALAGVVKDLQSRLGIAESDYIAGFWRIHLKLDLLWQVVGLGRRQRTYRAPTWSWASVDGEIRFRRPDEGWLGFQPWRNKVYTLNKILEIATPTAEQSPTPARTGYIVIEGPLRRAHLRNPGEDIFGHGAVKLDGTVYPNCESGLDDARLNSEWPAAGREVFCAFFRAGVAVDTGYLEGLILERAGSGRGEYHRIGWLRIHTSEPFQLLDHPSGGREALTVEHFTAISDNDVEFKFKIM